MSTDNTIKEYERKNGFTLSAHNRSVLRGMIEKENKHELRMQMIQDQEYKWGEPK